MKTVDLEQASRLHSAHTAFSWVLEKINSGASLESVKIFCALRKNACEQQMNLLLNSENEIGVSDSINEHVSLPHVRKSECEAKEADDSSGESEQITLGNRIDSGNKIFDCNKQMWNDCECVDKCRRGHDLVDIL